MTATRSLAAKRRAGKPLPTDVRTTQCQPSVLTTAGATGMPLARHTADSLTGRLPAATRRPWPVALVARGSHVPINGRTGLLTRRWPYIQRDTGSLQHPDCPSMLEDE